MFVKNSKDDLPNLDYELNFVEKILYYSRMVDEKTSEKEKKDYAKRGQASIFLTQKMKEFYSFALIELVYLDLSKYSQLKIKIRQDGFIDSKQELFIKTISNEFTIIYTTIGDSEVELLIVPTLWANTNELGGLVKENRGQGRIHKESMIRTGLIKKMDGSYECTPLALKIIDTYCAIITAIAQKFYIEIPPELKNKVPCFFF